MTILISTLKEIIRYITSVTMWPDCVVSEVFVIKSKDCLLY